MTTSTIIDVMHAVVKHAPIHMASMLRHCDDDWSRWQRAVAVGVKHVRESQVSST